MNQPQTISLLKEILFVANDISICRPRGDALVLKPVSLDWSWLETVVGPVDEDFAAATEERPDSQLRPDLEFFD